MVQGGQTAHNGTRGFVRARAGNAVRQLIRVQVPLCTAEPGYTKGVVPRLHDRLQLEEGCVTSGIFVPRLG